MRVRIKRLFVRLRAHIKRRAFLTEMLTLLCGALLARVLLPGNVSPLGTAFFAAAWMAGYNPYYPFAGVILGSLLCPFTQWANVCSASLFLLLGLLWRAWQGRVKQPVKLLLFAVSHLLVLPFFFFDSLDHFMLGFIQLAAAAALVIILQHALRLLTKFPLKRLLKDHEQLSLCFLFSVMLMGLTDISFLGFSLPIALAALGVLFITYAKGIVSLAVAVAIGSLLALSGHVGLLFIGSIAVCTFAALICRRLGRWGIGTAFLICDLVIRSYVGGSLQYALPPQSLIPALAAFLLIPQRTMNYLRGYIDPTVRSEHQTHNALAHLRAHAAQQLSCTADAFDEVSALLDAQQEPCAPEVRRMREESQRTFLHLQMRGVCGVMRDLARHMKENTYPDETLTAQLRQQLPVRLHARDVLVFRTNGRLHARLNVPKSLAAHPAVLMCAQQALHTPMRMLSANTQAQRCVLDLEEACMLRCSMGAAGLPLAGQLISGDSMGERQLAGGKALFALSDGMGSGADAKKESEHALQLLFRLYEAGFSRDTALPCVNRLLRRYNGSEIYATLDMLYLDLKTGHAEFIKFGAPASFVLRGGVVHPVYAEALPAGIVDEALPAIHAARMQKGDTVVLMTDGMFDVFGDDVCNEILLCVGGANTSKDGANALLSSAFARHPQDDMSVMVIRIF